jgi:hypothetical protein
MGRSQGAGGDGGARRRRWLTWLPVAALLGGAANHFWHVQRDHLSPWLGAGFGMFATSDVGSARSVHVVVGMADGSERAVELPGPFEELLARARALPTREWLGEVAYATRRHLLDATPDVVAGRPLQVRVEVWRTLYEPGTLRASPVRLAAETFTVAADGD